MGKARMQFDGLCFPRRNFGYQVLEIASKRIRKITKKITLEGKTKKATLPKVKDSN
jgi:hypothetical protein